MGKPWGVLCTMLRFLIADQGSSSSSMALSCTSFEPQGQSCHQSGLARGLVTAAVGPGLCTQSIGMGLNKPPWTRELLMHGLPAGCCHKQSALVTQASYRPQNHSRYQQRLCKHAGGYMVMLACTAKYVFDLQPEPQTPNL